MQDYLLECLASKPKFRNSQSHLPYMLRNNVTPTWHYLSLCYFCPYPHQGWLRLCCDMSHWIAVSPLQSQCLKGSSEDMIGEQLPQRGQGLTSLGSAVSVVETWIAGWNIFVNTRFIQSRLSSFFKEWILDTFWELLVLCWISLLWSITAQWNSCFPLSLSNRILETLPRGHVTLRSAIPRLCQGK